MSDLNEDNSGLEKPPEEVADPTDLAKEHADSKSKEDSHGDILGCSDSTNSPEEGNFKESAQVNINSGFGQENAESSERKQNDDVSAASEAIINTGVSENLESNRQISDGHNGNDNLFSKDDDDDDKDLKEILESVADKTFDSEEDDFGNLEVTQKYLSPKTEEEPLKETDVTQEHFNISKDSSEDGNKSQQQKENSNGEYNSLVDSNDIEDPKKNEVSRNSESEEECQDDLNERGQSPKGEQDSEKQENGFERMNEKQTDKMSDEDYFSQLPQEDLDWFKEHGPKPENILDKIICCTSCQKQIPNTNASVVQRHPVLGVVICRPCKSFYCSGKWPKDEDGCDRFCRWCGEGGELLICDKCPHAFCKRCIQGNLGRRFYNATTQSEEWACFICNPKQIYKFRAIYYALSKGLQNLKEKKSAMMAKRKTSLVEVLPNASSAVSSRASVDNDSISNFIDENIASAYKTLQLYQKALEDEKHKWQKYNKKMSADVAGSVCKNLRRIYSTTKLNMDLLDQKLTFSYADKFPRATAEAIRIGRVTPQSCLVPDSLKPTAVNRKAPTSVPQKRKLDSMKAGEIHINGSPVTEDIDPSSMLEVQISEDPKPAKKYKPGPACSKKPILEGSSRKPVDVESGGEDEIQVIKTPVKRRPGPKSKTMIQN